MKTITAEAFYEHLKADAYEFKEARIRDEEAKKERAELRKGVANVHIRMESLATREDAQQIMDIVKGLNFSGKAVIWIGGICGAVLSIWGMWQAFHISK